MKKTTVYLTEEEAESLRQAATRTGHSRSDLIREGIRRVTRSDTKRRFLSMGVGEGTGEPVGRRAEEILAKTLTPRR